MKEKNQSQPDEPSKRPFQPEKLNPIVYRILSEASSELAGYYLGAHKTLEDASNPERFPSAAHSLRELIEKLPSKNKRAVKIEKPVNILALPIYEVSDAWKEVTLNKADAQTWVLEPVDKGKVFLKKSEHFWGLFARHYPSRSESRLKFSQQVQKSTPLPSELQEEQQKLWGDFYSAFADISHHREPRNAFNGIPFSELVENFEEFLIRELDPQTTKDFARISTLIKEIESGNQENVTEIMQLVRANRPNYDHFFASISSPTWLKILEDNHLTNYLDDPIPTEEGGYMLLTWTPGQYYEKIASSEPDRVASIITALPKTDNARVHEQVVEIAKKLPKKQAVCIVSLLPEWIKGRFSVGRGLLPFKAGEYIVELARMGAYDDAIKVFRALFELQPPPETDKYFRHPETLTTDTSYKTILKDTVPSLMELNPESTIKELCDLLESGLRIEERDNNKEKDGIIYDGSTIWRPDIRKPHYDNEPNPILVTRIYTSITSYAKTPKQKLAIINILTSYKFEIFHRIAATIAEGEKDPALKKVYDDLVKKVEPSKPDFIVSEGTVVPAVSVDDMKKLSPEELIKLLNEWDPKEDFPGFGRSKSDIGHVLSQYIQEKPVLLKQLFESESTLNDEYYGYLFRGIRMASDNKQVVVDWDPVLKHGRKFLEASDTSNSEGDERQAQFDLLNAIESGINHDHIKVTSPELAEDILAVITPLCSHVEPSVEDEATRDKNGRFDSVGLAINTMRGEALSGLIALLKNVSRNGKKLKEKPLTPEQRKGIYDLLEKHLDIKHEATMAVRTVFARELPFLAYDNKAWVKKNLDKIFPRDKRQDKYFVDAMEAFLQFTKPFPEVFPLVVPYIIEYMKRVQRGAIKGDDGTTINHVVGQILLLYIDDFVKLDDPVMDELFKMPDDYLEEAMDFFGRGIKQTSGDRQKLILQKAKDYWQKRLDSDNTRKAEYSKFGWWLRVSAADDWIKEHFSQALKETDQMDALYFVADEIVEIAKADEAGAATALLEIVDTQHKDNLINMLHTPELRDTLKALLESEQASVKEKAVRVIDKLCSMGFYNFKELLNDEDNA